MDLYRQNFLKAQEIAKKIVQADRNQFLSEVTSGEICIDQNSFVPAVSRWFQLRGYRMKTDLETTVQSACSAAREWIRSAGASGGSAVFVIEGKNGKTGIYYGSGKHNRTEALFGGSLPECSGADTGWEGEAYSYNGIVTGTLTLSNIADVAAQTGIKNYYAACIIVPISEEEVQQRIAENERMAAYLNDYKSFQRVYGNVGRRVQEVPLPIVVRAIAVLKEETEFLIRNTGTGLVRSAVHFGAADSWSYHQLKSVIVSCMNHTDEKPQRVEAIRCFEVNGIHRNWKECLALPCILHNGNYHYMASWQTIDHAAGFCMPPLESHPGFYVKNYHVDENAEEVFPLSEAISEPGIHVGKIYGAGWDAVIPYHSLLSHSFVCGSPNNGKTTTVKRMLKELYDEGIPFVVIEAAKKEYIGLLSDIAELRVYTPGTDGIRLVVNPLQPEDGVLIENQADAVVRALVASHGGEHPIPEALDGLLKQTYEKSGWNYGMMAYQDSNRPFPTFADALKNIPEYIENHAQYGPEVKKNLQAALTIRTEHMESGALGSIVGQPSGLTAQELLAVPSVIELADFSSSSAEFLMNILLFKFHSYLSRLPQEHSLKRVIVVEEAHNVFRKTLSEESGRALNNHYFERMLAEIRSSGTGMILSDQRPSMMSEAVMANTTVKIVHSMGAEKDWELIGRSMGLSEFQITKTREFSPGECIIGINGRYGILHTRVQALQTAPMKNAACHICTSRFRCRREAVRSMLCTMDQTKIRFHLSRIQSHPYNIHQLVANIDTMLRELHVIASVDTKVCLLGEILFMNNRISEQDSRVITTSYFNYVRGGTV